MTIPEYNGPPKADVHGREYARDGTSPTFVAPFADGITTRMTCHCTSDHLDLARGMKLSRAAYESRTRKSPPAIVKARFVKPFSDETIKSYSHTELGLICALHERQLGENTRSLIISRNLGTA